jgi:glycosyltransferase involved in cell wall biosynthesis
MLVSDKATNDEDVREISKSLVRVLDRAAYHVLERLDLQYLFYPSSFYLRYDQWFRESDIIQLFNTHNNYFSHTALPFLSRRKPIVWRLSDMWAMTGHCAHSLDCERWLSGCGACPYLSEYPALRRDTTAFLWRTKQRIYAKTNLHIVAPSEWMAGVARRSPLLKNCDVHHIPNGTDISVFSPIEKSLARQQIGIETKKTVILFSSHLMNLALKGKGFVEQAINSLAAGPLRDQVMLLVVGRQATDWRDSPMETVRLEHIDDDRALAAVYSAADIFILPTLADTSPNSVLESMACGTPAVTFDVGGCPDLVQHMETGYLARYKDTGDFINGLVMLINDTALRERLGRAAVALVRHKFRSEQEGRRFKSLYEDIIREANELTPGSRQHSTT